MSAAQLTATSVTVSSRGLPSFEGLRNSSVKVAAFAPLRKSLNQRCFSTLVVKAAIVVTPKHTSVTPLADRVLVKIKEPEEKTSGEILLPITAVTKPQAGEVVAVGEGKTVGKNKIDFSVKTGTKVVFSKNAGTELKFNGLNHLLLKEDDIVGILETDDIQDLKPLNDRVLIKVAEAEQTTAGGLFLPQASKKQPTVGTVVAVGPGPLDENGNREPISVSPGNTVMYSQYAGNEFKGKDGSEYIALRASNVMAVFS